MCRSINFVCFSLDFHLKSLASKDLFCFYVFVVKYVNSAVKYVQYKLYDVSQIYIFTVTNNFKYDSFQDIFEAICFRKMHYLERSKNKFLKSIRNSCHLFQTFAKNICFQFTTKMIASFKCLETVLLHYTAFGVNNICSVMLGFVVEW